MIASFALRRLLLAAALFGPMSAWSQSGCENQCMADYRYHTYPIDQRGCMRTIAPGRCIEETIANAREYCRSRCAAGLAPPQREEISIPPGTIVPDSNRNPNPNRRPTDSVGSGTRG